jgi:hypothetical protein
MNKFIKTASIIVLAIGLVFSPLTALAKSKHKQEKCKVAYGHLVSPKWLKNHDWAQTDIQNCKGKIPRGIWKKVYGNHNQDDSNENDNDDYNEHNGHNGQNNTDTSAPLVSTIAINNITQTTASIVVTSNEAMKAVVSYGLTSTYGTNTTVSPGFATSQTIPLAGLTANTVYHYQVKISDPANNSTTSSDATFTTSVADSVAPVISGLSTSGITHIGATVNWTTDELASTEVRYGLTTAYGTNIVDAALSLSHSKVISGLTANTLYHYIVISKDANNNTTTSTDQTFTTLIAPDVTAPIISAVGISGITNSSVTIGWLTNETTSSKIFYSTTTPVNKATATVVSDASLITNHSLSLPGLTSNTHYYFLIESKDAALNMTTATEGAFTTAI